MAGFGGMAPLALALALALAGCAPATMAGLATLAPVTDTVEVIGIGAGRSGGFTLTGGATGRFTRSLATRAEDAVDDRPIGFTSRYGTLGFTVTDTGRGPLAGECRFGRIEHRDLFGSATASVETDATLAPFRLGCRFTRAGAAVGGMGMEELHPTGPEVVERRAGLVEIDGHPLSIRSEHRVAEAPGLPVAVPIGYRFEDRRARAVGAVSVAGRPRILVPRDPAGRDTALAAGLALALFWDPSGA